MNALSKFTLALAGFALVALPADARSNWNRSVSNIHIVHPPGTPQYSARVDLIRIVNDDGSNSGPLSFDSALSINGTVVSVVSVPIEPNSTPSVCPGACSGGCSLFQSLGVPLAGSCSTMIGCQCAAIVDVDNGLFTAAPGSLCTVSLTATPGSLPEIDTSDDSISIVVPENNPGTLTCAGDGTGVACPCANSGASGRGCSNSSNPSGAELSATGYVEGDLLTGNDAVVLHVTGMTVGAPLLYFQGTSNALTIPFGDGTLCTTGSIIRLRVKINVGGASQFPEPGDPSVSVTGGVTPGSGATRYYQAYYRDSASYCTSATFNMTNGISLTWY